MLWPYDIIARYRGAHDAGGSPERRSLVRNRRRPRAFLGEKFSVTDRFVRQLGDNCRARLLDVAGEPRPDATGDPPAEKRTGRGRIMELRDYFG